ncbi:MAG: hypothetical protein WCZ43_04595 [Proteiniphilum sp.]
MKRIFVLALLGLGLMTQTHGQTAKKQNENKVGKTYKNELFRFSATVPDSWRLYGQIVNDTIHHMAIADWGLPLVYSELEKVEIENSVSIVAYKRKEINSVEELSLFEYARYMGNSNRGDEIVMEVDQVNPDARFLHITKTTGVKFRAKQYLVFKDNTGYVVTFMATPGTYDKNLNAFEEFYKNVRFE